MLFLLRNRRLRLQVLVLASIIGAGLLPDKTSGVKCYDCVGPNCKTNYTTEPVFECSSGYCKRANIGPISTLRSCVRSLMADCVFKRFPGGCYIDSMKISEELYECAREPETDDNDGAAARMGTEGNKNSREVCICKGDLCNGDDSGNVSTTSTSSNTTNVTRAGAATLVSRKELCTSAIVGVAVVAGLLMLR